MARTPEPAPTPAAAATPVAAPRRPRKRRATVSPPAGAAPPTGSVTIRMYRGILGDCFLLTIKVGDDDRVVLIDCGVLQNVQDGATMLDKLPPSVIAAAGEDALRAVVAGPDRIAAVVSDVFAAVGKRPGAKKNKIDVLVVTHEHYDHISGFALNADRWRSDAVAIDQLWMAWTENPADPDAKRVAALLGKQKDAVRAAATTAEALRLDAADEFASVNALLDFLGPEAPGGDAALAVDGGATGGRMTTAATMQMLKDKVGAARVRFLEPGMVIDPLAPEKTSRAEAPLLRTFVLGPPRNIDRMRKDSPTKDSGEVYEAAAAAPAVDRAFAVSSAVAALTTDPKLGITPCPFARPHRRPYQWVAPSPATPTSQVATDAASNAPSPLSPRDHLIQLYEAQDELSKARRIESAWLGGVESLALKLDSDTNNTSLVLAFALPPEDNRLLLFAADAQVGNWQSWGDQAYPKEAAAGQAQLSIDQLLARTIFYKVGHHGSHNATAKERGLQLMTHPDLCAAIPVVEAVARIQGPGKKTAGKGWHMPFEPMYEDLKARTGGDEAKGKHPRIVRGDGDPIIEQAAFAGGPATIAYDPNGLWVELTFKF